MYLMFLRALLENDSSICRSGDMGEEVLLGKHEALRSDVHRAHKGLLWQRVSPRPWGRGPRQVGLKACWPATLADFQALD